ncbi:hypothetical protein ACFQET_08565 [Levilactobacillus tangyuanensis]|uniref:Uncharacterized protein n=1 Tax=Levilactobacillus tangyuanensis TaxID=2486021 RepID=A0ABW1TNX4_9LACO|nr:hypothetical protein [Levilactobacillus tangyuanensis]
MTENIVLAPPAALELAKHLDEWSKWRQTKDPLTADRDWQRFIAKSRDKAEWEAGLAVEIDRWEALHAIQLTLEDSLLGIR